LKGNLENSYKAFADFMINEYLLSSSSALENFSGRKKILEPIDFFPFKFLKAKNHVLFALPLTSVMKIKAKTEYGPTGPF